MNSLPMNQIRLIDRFKLATRRMLVRLGYQPGTRAVIDAHYKPENHPDNVPGTILLTCGHEFTSLSERPSATERFCPACRHHWMMTGTFPAPRTAR